MVKDPWIYSVFFSLSPIDFLVEKNRSMDVASWWDESLIISEENGWKGFLIRTRPNPRAENLYIVMDGVCISLVTADGIIIRPRGVNCAKKGGQWIRVRRVFGRGWRKERKEKKKERNPSWGCGGNWRDVVASVEVEPRLSEVHEAQSHDSWGRRRRRRRWKDGGVGVRKRVIRKKEVNKMEM